MRITIYKKIAITMFLVMLAAPVVLRAFGLGVVQTRLNEKRTLAVFPTAYSDTISNEISKWFADNAPFRESAIEKDNRVAQINNRYYYSGLGTAIKTVATPSWYKASGGQEYYPLFVKNQVAYGRQDWLFYEGEYNLDFYRGANVLGKDTMKEWRDIYEELDAICKNKGIDLVVLIAPNKEQVYPGRMASLKIRNENKREDRFSEYMKDSGVTYLYPLDEMKEAGTRFDTYWQQDTHWNSYGAYIGARCIYDVLGIRSPSTKEIQIRSRKKTGGDLSDMCGYATEYEAPEIDYKKDVEVYSDIRDNIEIYRSSANTGRNLVLVSDSFRESIRKYFARDFDACTSLHRDFLESEIATGAIRGLGDGDVLVLLAVERYDAANVDTAMRIIDILN